MDVILLENIKSLGKIGDVVNIKRGYGRNFLIKYGKALKASKENIDIVNKKKLQLNEKNASLKKASKKIYDVINSKKYTFLRRVKDNNELYGSVKPKEISNIIEESDKIEIKPSQVDLSKEINKIGSYEAKINLHAEVQAKILIEVVKEEEKN
jgi:large subunit ribosomal protein L9